MFFSKDAKRAFSAVEDLRRDIESVKVDLDVLKENVEEDILNIKDDFRELVHYLEQNTYAEDEKNKEDMAAVKDEDDSQDVKSEAVSLEASLTNILEMTKEMKAEVDGLKKNIQSEVGSIKVTIKEEIVTATKKLDDARKDIKNKISYSLSRLRA